MNGLSTAFGTTAILALAGPVHAERVLTAST